MRFLLSKPQSLNVFTTAQVVNHTPEGAVGLDVLLCNTVCKPTPQFSCVQYSHKHTHTHIQTLVGKFKMECKVMAWLQGLGQPMGNYLFQPALSCCSSVAEITPGTGGKMTVTKPVAVPIKPLYPLARRMNFPK